ncbi:hypothetical protein HaLaN_20418, partial [Haematococcus lacustris]
MTCQSGIAAHKLDGPQTLPGTVLTLVRTKGAYSHELRLVIAGAKTATVRHTGQSTMSFGGKTTSCHSPQARPQGLANISASSKSWLASPSSIKVSGQCPGAAAVAP